VLTLDFWAQYNVTKEVFLAAEYANTDGGVGKKGSSWLAEVGYAPAGPVSWVFRLSGDEPDKSVSASKYTQYTICPTYKFTDNLSVRAEYSYYDYKGGSTKTFGGVQALFKF
jgi:predicted porin